MTHVWTGPHPKPYRHYKCDGSMTTPSGERIVSVTTALGVLDKPALLYWAANQTAEGAWRLMQTEGYTLPDEGWKLHSDMKRAGLDAFARRDEAAERGTGIHKINEDWINHGTIPKPSEVLPSWRGYLKAWLNWITAEEPTFLESELVVGSATHGYAGTRDTVVRTMVPGRGRVLFDLKTSKRVYPTSHFPQLMAYEIAGVECGEDPTDAQAIVRLDEDGSYEIVYSVAEPEDFLSVLRAYRSQKGLEQRFKKWGKG